MVAKVVKNCIRTGKSHVLFDPLAFDHQAAPQIPPPGPLLQLIATATHGQGLVLFDTLAVDHKTMLPLPVNGSFAPTGGSAQLFKVEAGGALTPLTPARTFFGTDLPEAARV